MFDSISKKIKVIAKAGFVISLITMVIAGLAAMVMGMFLVGLIIMAVGILDVWIHFCLIYGFGELIEKTCDIAENTYGIAIKSAAQSKAYDVEIDKI